MKTYVVRVVQTLSQLNRLGLGECRRDLKFRNYEGGEISENTLQMLEHSGHITRHEVDPKGLSTLCFDINPPSYHRSPAQSHAWATVLTEKMRKMGFNAVVAPSTLISSNERIEKCRK